MGDSRFLPPSLHPAAHVEHADQDIIPCEPNELGEIWGDGWRRLPGQTAEALEELPPRVEQ